MENISRNDQDNNLNGVVDHDYERPAYITMTDTEMNNIMTKRFGLEAANDSSFLLSINPSMTNKMVAQ